MERENVLTVTAAFALGSMAGAALALLYAPYSGQETRRRMSDGIRRGAERGREKLREGAEYTREKIQQGAEYGREKIQQGAEYGRQMAQRVTGKAEEVAEEAMAYAEGQSDVSAFGERRRKPRTVSPEVPESV